MPQCFLSRLLHDMNIAACATWRLNRLLDCFLVYYSLIQDTACVSTEARIAL